MSYIGQQRPQVSSADGEQLGIIDDQLISAWVNFNGATGTVLDGYNVSSVTRTGTGRYLINFENDLANINYGVGGSVVGSSTALVGGVSSDGVSTVSQAKVSIYDSGNDVFQDAGIVALVVFGGTA